MRENEIVESTRQRANIQPHSPRDDGPVPRHDLEGHAADAVGGVAALATRQRSSEVTHDPDPGPAGLQTRGRRGRGAHRHGPSLLRPLVEAEEQRRLRRATAERVVGGSGAEAEAGRSGDAPVPQHLLGGCFGVPAYVLCLVMH